MTTNKPKVPLTVYALTIVSGAGLIALLLAAFEVFKTVSATPLQAWAAAGVIEAGLVVESIAFARSRNRLALFGLCLSFIVSASYNYTQASDYRPDLRGWQLVALSVGPLSALTFVSLSLGDELRKYTQAIKSWADEAVEYERKEEALARRREERRRLKLETVQVAGQSIGEGSTDRARPVARWSDRAQFVDDARSDPALLDLSGAEIGQLAGGKAPKTGRRWKAYAREIMGENGRGS